MISHRLKHQPTPGTVCGVKVDGSEWTVSMHDSVVYAVQLNGVWYIAEALCADLLDEIEAEFKVMA